MKENMLIIHGGGPTAVINSSLYGVIEEALKHSEVGEIYAAAGGTGGLLKRKIINLRKISRQEREILKTSPASAIGTSRDFLAAEDYEEMPKIFKELGVKYVLLNGGNGTMDTCGKIYEQCKAEGISVMGIPKTMDNDIAVTDHSPGFGSAARFMAGSMAELCADIRGLPIHISVVEAMGRSAGWVAAAAALAVDSGVGAPDLIYLPERNFDEEAFLTDAERLIKSKGCGVIVASEGLHFADGKPIAPPVMTIGRATYFGDVSAHLAGLITKKLGFKARSEKPGLLSRASIAWQSTVDRDEAILAGSEAVKAILSGESGKMVGFERVSTSPYCAKPILIDVKKVMLEERLLPNEFINVGGNGVTMAFLDWCRPLLGEALPRLANFSNMVEDAKV